MLRYYWSRLFTFLKPSSIKGTKKHKSATICGGSQIIDVSMGRYSYCGHDCKIINTEIGAFCSIADCVKIGLAPHPLEWVSTSPAFYYGRGSVKKRLARNYYATYPKRTKIGNDVWIGENVLIKDGLNISDGAVIGMGAVVTHDVGPYEIWAGNPAKLIKKRFDEETINKLVASKWWGKTEEELICYSDRVNDVNLFLAGLENK